MSEERAMGPTQPESFRGVPLQSSPPSGPQLGPAESPGNGLLVHRAVSHTWQSQDRSEQALDPGRVDEMFPQFFLILLENWSYYVSTMC